MGKDAAPGETVADRIERLGVRRIRRHIFICADQSGAKCCSKEAGLEAWQYLDSRAESLVSDFSDPSALVGLENDPQAMGRMMRKMGKEMGEELPPEFNEVVDRLEKGQSPEEIEKEIPDLGGGESDE